MKYVYAGAAIRFTPKEIVIAGARLTNEDAKCTVDEVWVMHDVHFDVCSERFKVIPCFSMQMVDTGYNNRRHADGLTYQMKVITST